MVDNSYDSYCYEYYSAEEKHCYTLTEEEKNAVDAVLTEVKPIASYDLGYMPEVKHTIRLNYLQSDTDITCNWQILKVLEDGYCFIGLRDNGITEYYIVPEDLEPLFDSITKDYCEK